MNLKNQIEILIEENAEDFTIAKVFKNHIKEHNLSLNDYFLKSAGKDFSVHHAKMYDTLLKLMYKVVIRKAFGNYLPMINTIPIALVALGSYGREQLSVYSDIDLMIAYREIAGYNTKPLIEKLLYLAWDSGFNLGHRVHEVNDLLDASRKDITIKTSLIEARFIGGSIFTWNEVQNEIKAIRFDDQEKFISEKVTEAKERFLKYPQSMQPNIKEGFGGLRDAQLVFWILKVLYNVNSIKNQSVNLFTDEEYRDFRISLEFLFKVRNGLHLITKKKQDKLILDYIPELTKLLKLKNQTVLIKKTLQSMQTIHQFSAITVSKVLRKHRIKKENITLFRSKRFTTNIYICNNKIYTRFNIKPFTLHTLLEFLILLPENITKFDPSFHDLIAKTIIPDKIESNTYMLVKELYNKINIYSIFKVLYDNKILRIIVHPLRKILYLAQFDGYHNYAVDLHSLHCLKALENIRDSRVKIIYDSLDKENKQLLNLIVLIHDSGKGRKEDHSEVGANLFKVYAKHLNLTKDEIDIGVNLIRYHTHMSSLAFKQDIHHDNTVLKFIAKLKTKLKIDMLYILTYADINGVSKSTYSEYNSSLINQLYVNTLELLNRKELITETQKRTRKENSIKKQESFQKLIKIKQKKILNIESNLFFIKHNVLDILQISDIAFDIQNFKYTIQNETFLSIEIYRTIPLNLGYLLSKLSFLNVKEMEIFTLFNNVKYFKINFSDTLNEMELERVKEILEYSFDMNKKFRLSTPSIQEEDIYIDCLHSKSYYQFSINAKNQKGLLAFIMSIFDQENINISTAKIHTVKNKVKDMFLIERSEPLCLKQNTIIKALSVH